MAYIYNIPQANDQISVSQGQILGNFIALGAIAGNGSNSSAALNNVAGFNWLYLPPQGATPPALSMFAAGNIGLYSAVNATTAKNELYINKTNQATVVQIPATASILSTASAPGVGATGWTYLPSGILMKWGTNAAPVGGSPGGGTTVTYNIGPAFNQVFVVIPGQFFTGAFTTTGSNGFAVHSITNPLNFTYSWSGNNSANTFITWIAIGY